MRELDVSELIPQVKKLCIEANYFIGEDVLEKLEEALTLEESPVGKEILRQILTNHRMASQEEMPACQDTGVAVVFVELGQELHLKGGDLYAAINEGVRQGYKDGYLRKSMVDDPVIERKNTGDKTPAIIHLDIVPGDRIKITVAPKGGGSENMSEVKMLTPAQGLEGVMDFVVDRVRRSGGNPCPPIIVGVGIGGNFESCALLAKKALMRDLRDKHPEEKWAKVEDELLHRINRLGIGPMGLGGRVTALGVKILTLPCHIASMPVAVNIQCHAARHKTVTV